MIGLDKFIELFKDTKVIIPTLVAIILVGALGGGFWVNNLKQTIDTYDEISQGKLDVTNERYRNTIQNIEKQYKDFEYETNQTIRYLELNQDTLINRLTNIEKIVSSQKDTIVSQKVKSEIQKIGDEQDRFKLRIENLKGTVEFYQGSYEKMVTSKSELRNPPGASNPIFFIFIFLLVLFTIAFVKVIRRKRK